MAALLAAPVPRPRIGRAVIRTAGGLLLAAIVASIAWTASYRWRDPAVDAWVPLAEVSETLQAAVVLAEDQHFCLHRGFDFGRIEAALAAARAGAPLVGASTISQQLARTLFLWPGRSWTRKALEAWFTVWLEMLLPKARILELYLNVVDWGPQARGVAAAVRRHLGPDASPARVGARPAAHLAVLLPSPARYADRLPPEVALRRDHIEHATLALGPTAIACLR